MGEFSHGPAWLPHLARSNCCQGRLHQGRFNNRIVLSSMNIVLKFSELRLSTALPPPGREGYCLMWLILGCAAGQDMILVSVPKHGKLFYAHLPQPGIVSTIDIPFRFSVLNRARVSNPQRHNYTQTLVKRPFLPPTPGSRRGQEKRDSAEPRLRDAECYEVSVAKIMEHSNSGTKCNNITCSG